MALKSVHVLSASLPRLGGYAGLSLTAPYKLDVGELGFWATLANKEISQSVMNDTVANYLTCFYKDNRNK